MQLDYQSFILKESPIVTNLLTVSALFLSYTYISIFSFIVSALPYQYTQLNNGLENK